MAPQKLGTVQWGDLTFGPGTAYAVTGLEGLDDLPDIRGEDVERTGQHGDYTGPDWTGPRTVTLKLGMHTDSPDSLRALSLALRNATQPQRQPAALQFPDQDVLVWAKVRKRSIPYDAEYLWSIGDAALEFYCADPYLYGLTEKSETTTAYSPAAGRTYPLVYGEMPYTARNLVLNPSTEVGLTDVTAYNSATVNRITSDAQFGSACVQVTNTTGTFGGAQYTMAGQPGGTVITASAWVKASGGSTCFFAFRSDTATLGVTSVGTPTTGQWTRLTGQYTVPAGQTCTQVAIAYNSDPGVVWQADGMMAEAGVSGPSDYVDGTQPGCVWEGTAHDSPSRRTNPDATGRSYGSVGQSGRITATNEGASPAYPVLRLDGPVANPSIEQTNTGSILVLDATLQAGEWLTIDTRSRAVLYMGSTPRRDWVRAGSAWPLLQPGPNEIAYRGDALAGSTDQPSLLTVTWRDTSL